MKYIGLVLVFFVFILTNIHAAEDVPRQPYSIHVNTATGTDDALDSYSSSIALSTHNKELTSEYSSGKYFHNIFDPEVPPANRILPKVVPKFFTLYDSPLKPPLANIEDGYSKPSTSYTSDSLKQDLDFIPYLIGSTRG